MHQSKFTLISSNDVLNQTFKKKEYHKCTRRLSSYVGNKTIFGAFSGDGFLQKQLGDLKYIEPFVKERVSKNLKLD